MYVLFFFGGFFLKIDQLDEEDPYPFSKSLPRTLYGKEKEKKTRKASSHDLFYNRFLGVWWSDGGYPNYFCMFFTMERGCEIMCVCLGEV